MEQRKPHWPSESFVDIFLCGKENHTDQNVSFVDILLCGNEKHTDQASHLSTYFSATKGTLYWPIASFVGILPSDNVYIITKQVICSTHVSQTMYRVIRRLYTSLRQRTPYWPIASFVIMLNSNTSLWDNVLLTKKPSHSWTQHVLTSLVFFIDILLWCIKNHTDTILWDSEHIQYQPTESPMDILQRLSTSHTHKHFVYLHGRWNIHISERPAHRSRKQFQIKLTDWPKDR